MDNEELYTQQKHVAVTFPRHLSEQRADVDFRHCFLADGPRKQSWDSLLLFLALMFTYTDLYWAHSLGERRGVVEALLALLPPVARCADLPTFSQI